MLAFLDGAEELVCYQRECGEDEEEDDGVELEYFEGFGVFVKDEGFSLVGQGDFYGFVVAFHGGEGLLEVVLGESLWGYISPGVYGASFPVGYNCRDEDVIFCNFAQKGFAYIQKHVVHVGVYFAVGVEEFELHSVNVVF